MPPRAIAIDITRLSTRIGQPSPTGIDRVELAYARHILSGDGPRCGVVLTAMGPRVLDRADARAVVEAAAAGWTEEAAAETDPAYCRLGALPAPPARAPSRGRPAAPRRARAEILVRAVRGRHARDLPASTLYCHVSHLRLERARWFDWLYARPDIRPVFTIHDLIPVQYPEYCRRGEAERHAARLGTVARHAAHVLVDSSAVGDDLRAHLAARHLAVPPMTTAPLGIEPAFLEAGRSADAIPPFERPTFVVCGTIEARKNHLVLLNVWRRFAERGTGPIPRLVIVGRRGWEAESAVAMLERCPGLRGHVEEVADLSTPGLAALMRRSTALLMPSFSEGFGLPMLEAAACGLPVVASDIPVHREVAGAFAHFVDPTDGRGWLEAVDALSGAGSALRAALVGRLAAYAVPTWARHFERVEQVAAGLVDGARPTAAPAPR